MADPDKKIKRLLIIRFRALGDPSQARALIQPSISFYRALGASRARLLQNVDEPAQFSIEIEYEADAALELSRQKVAGDPMVRGFLQGWQGLLAGSADMNVYEDVTP
jgi:hypothetical protein